MRKHLLVIRRCKAQVTKPNWTIEEVRMLHMRKKIAYTDYEKQYSFGFQICQRINYFGSARYR